MPPRRKQGMSTQGIIAIIVIVILLGVGAYFLQRSLLAQPGTFGYSLPESLYVVPPADFTARDR